MRKRYRPQKFILLLSLCASAAIVAPIVKTNMHRLGPVMQSVGERLALISAFSDLPDRSRELLEKRFNDEIFYENEPDTTPLPNPDTSSSSSAASSDTPNSSSTPPAEASSASAAENTSSASSAVSSAPETPKPKPPEIPKAYRGPMLEEDLSGFDSKSYINLSPAGYLRNYTELTQNEILEVLKKPTALKVQDASQPQVLIYHTHATEAFERYDSDTYDTRNNWRSTDNNMNMVAVGNALAETLKENGIHVIHDDTQHDYPSYNGAYDRSAKTIASYLEEYPSIQILLDVHRDAIDRNGTLVRPVTTINGKKAAQLMMIVGSDDGSMNMPEWRDNLRFASVIQSQAEQDFPKLMRPIFFCYRKYNLDKTPGSLLLEFGSHGNTLEECIYTAQLVGKSIATAIKSVGPETDVSN